MATFTLMTGPRMAPLVSRCGFGDDGIADGPLRSARKYNFNLRSSTSSAGDIGRLSRSLRSPEFA